MNRLFILKSSVRALGCGLPQTRSARRRLSESGLLVVTRQDGPREGRATEPKQGPPTQGESRRGSGISATHGVQTPGGGPLEGKRRARHDWRGARSQGTTSRGGSGLCSERQCGADASGTASVGPVVDARRQHGALEPPRGSQRSELSSAQASLSHRRRGVETRA